MTSLERTVCARQFISSQLTSRERMLIASFALGFSQAEAARAWGISDAAISKMTRRIREKASRFWQSH